MTPGSFVGQLLGAAAVLALAVTMAYSVRRAMPAVRKLGPTRRYLELHVWAGGVFGILVLLHTGFSLPRSLFAVALWVSSVWVVITGIAGRVLQRVLPKILEPSASFEPHMQRMPEFVAELRTRADAVVKTADPHVKAYYEQRMAPDMAAPRFLAPAMFAARRGTPGRVGTGETDILRRILPPEGLDALTRLTELHATKHEIDVHFTIQRILRVWLVLHLPVAIALLVLVTLHVAFVIYY